MARRGWRLLVSGVVLGMGAGACGLVVTAAAPALAQDTPIASPFLNDGNWFGSLEATGPFDINEFHGDVNYAGTFEFTVSAGSVVGGTWEIGGNGVASHPRVTGTVTYWASGTMGGSADLPQMLPGGLVASYDLMVNGVPLSGTVEFGAAEVLPFSIPLLSASCDFAAGDWNVPANMVYQSAGGTSSITGFWFASRLGSPPGGGVDPNFFNPYVTRLMGQADNLMAAAMFSGEIDFDTLNQLISDAEFFNQRMILNAQCGGRNLRGWVSPIGPMMVNLLGWAFTNPDRLDNADLLRLIIAGVRTNALGSRAPDNERTRALLTMVAMELSRRAEREAGTCMQESQVYAAATVLGDPVVVNAVRSAMVEVCE